MKEWLFGKTLGQLQEIAAGYGMPKFTGKQIASRLYGKHVRDIEAMTDISEKNRAKLSADYCVGSFDPADVMESVDGTKKYLFPTLGGQSIESAYIPDRDRVTLCVSSQAGCRMGCKFCITARQGFQHNLSAGEILNQIRNLPEQEKLTNVVYMGMGEPLDNLNPVLESLEILTADWGYGWSPSRITLSMIGILPALTEFLTRSKVHLAVSLHIPFGDERRALMPGENAHRLTDVIAEIRKADFSGQRRVSFEYIMFRGVNDTPRHLKELVRITSGLKCRVNLIRFHAIPGSNLRGSDERTMIRFRDELSRKGIITTIRASRGEDIFAACGMLSSRHRDRADL